ncbi:hypothetical protein EJ08DRAFT_697071 [Tothia fuscella]|uniref:Uncharacterized protein n=1 Tax=Tothia fuscella TaxID=1048955 RepID=A0A9P4NSJ7_9PEZI|nr:hypothetical protein EJ08DRAFT_697071 [Tothia fuscella]
MYRPTSNSREYTGAASSERSSTADKRPLNNDQGANGNGNAKKQCICNSADNRWEALKEKRVALYHAIIHPQAIHVDPKVAPKNDLRHLVVNTVLVLMLFAQYLSWLSIIKLPANMDTAVKLSCFWELLPVDFLAEKHLSVNALTIIFYADFDPNFSVFAQFVQVCSLVWHLIMMDVNNQLPRSSMEDLFLAAFCEGLKNPDVFTYRNLYIWKWRDEKSTYLYRIVNSDHVRRFQYIQYDVNKVVHQVLQDLEELSESKRNGEGQDLKKAVMAYTMVFSPAFNTDASITKQGTLRRVGKVPHAAAITTKYPDGGLCILEDENFQLSSRGYSLREDGGAYLTKLLNTLEAVIKTVSDNTGAYRMPALTSGAHPHKDTAIRSFRTSIPRLCKPEITAAIAYTCNIIGSVATFPNTFPNAAKYFKTIDKLATARFTLESCISILNAKVFSDPEDVFGSTAAKLEHLYEKLAPLETAEGELEWVSLLRTIPGKEMRSKMYELWRVLEDQVLRRCGNPLRENSRDLGKVLKKLLRRRRGCRTCEDCLTMTQYSFETDSFESESEEEG